ncbi:MAG TPA: ATP-dependent helicase [Clostridiales bacterium]|nr:ATP-dependent helicase [Clostridiales bacterium]
MEKNQAQEEAISHKDGPLLVLAGPGSGKTLVITERTKHLIKTHKISENRILVITFTKAAAVEMKNRFLRLMGQNRTVVSFGTFHGIFFSILKRAYGFTAKNIVSEEARIQALNEIIHRQRLEEADEKEFVSDLISEISLVKGNMIDLNNYYSINCSDEVFRTIYNEYNSRLRQARLLDFDDMLVYCYELLSQRPDILKMWQTKFQYILIDEFQDINKLQYDIIRMLAAPEDNLFIVGDDDQSIYRFRGAKPEIMLNFPQDYPSSKKIVLDKNYRSTAKIVEAAGRLITHNEKRFKKSINTVREEGQDIVIKEFKTIGEENTKLVEEILSLNKKGIQLSKMAILVRTNMGYGALVHKLMEYNIPFTMRDSLPNIYDHWISTDIITYIKIALGNKERSNYLRIINRPKRYISRDCFDSPEVNLEDVKDYYEDKSWVIDRLEQLEYDLDLVASSRPYGGINYIRRGIGYEDYLKEYAEARKIKVEELTDIMDELMDNAKEFKSYEQWFSYIDEYKEQLKKQGEKTRGNDVDSVTIATIHSSKGLEFSVIFIVDANEGITPHKKAVLPMDIEEERRLFYVAMTRAKDYLYILSTRERYNKTMESSRFIEELKIKDTNNDC